MKKTIYLLTICLLTILMAVGCQSNKSGDTAGSGSKNSSKNAPLILGEKQTVKDFSEFTLEKIAFTPRINPPMTSGVYTYYEAKTEGMTLFRGVMDLKNISTADIDLSSSTKFAVTIDNKEYVCNAIVEENNGTDLADAFISPIKPLFSAKVNYYVEVPKDSEGKEIKYSFEINKVKYSGTFASEDFAVKKDFVKPGDKLTAEDFAEVTLSEITVRNRLNPSKPESFYTFYEAKDTSKTYIILKTQVKNLKSTGLSADEVMGVKLIYNDKYNYDSFSVVEEDNGSDLTYSNITNIDPLTSKYIYYLCEVPKEVAEGKAELEIYLNGKTVYLAK